MTTPSIRTDDKGYGMTHDQPYQFLPDLTVDEFAALKKSIADTGMGYAVIYDEDGNILDGHNRVRAWKELVREGKAVGEEFTDVRKGLTEAEKVALVLSLNLDRRHLTSVQKRDVIARVLFADPERSDRQVAKDIGVSHTTVSSVRDEAEQRGQIGHVAKTTDTLGREQPRKEPNNARNPKTLNTLKRHARQEAIANGHSPSSFAKVDGLDAPTATGYCRLCSKENRITVGLPLEGFLFELCKPRGEPRPLPIGDAVRNIKTVKNEAIKVGRINGHVLKRFVSDGESRYYTGCGKCDQDITVTPETNNLSDTFLGIKCPDKSGIEDTLRFPDSDDPHFFEILRALKGVLALEVTVPGDYGSEWTEEETGEVKDRLRRSIGFLEATLRRLSQ